MTHKQFTATTRSGITWHIEQEGTGPDVVLIPDGLGESQMFLKPMSAIAAAGFTVTTFDMPGMSRSNPAPPSTYQEVTASKLASYVVELMDELDMHDIVTFWGCSSGASTVLALAAEYPSRVRNAIVHEAPTASMDASRVIPYQLGDGTVPETMPDDYQEDRVGNREAWEALGEECHARLRKNYARWAKGYPPSLPGSTPIELEGLRRRPLDWTVGASTPSGKFLDNIITATRAGVPASVIPGKHFPYVSHPAEFASHVIETTRKYL